LSYSRLASAILAFFILLFFPSANARAQSDVPTNVSQVLAYSMLYQTSGGTGFPSLYTYNGPQVDFTPGTTSNFACTSATCPDLKIASYYTSAVTPHSIFGLTTTLNSSIATALSTIPLSSPASGVITKVDPATGAELPVSSTLGPIFTERGETIGKHRFYMGLSNQDFHFTSFNGQSLKPLHLMDIGTDTSTVNFNGAATNAFPATYNVQFGVRLSQNMAFLTYGVTNRFDISVGLSVTHSSVNATTSDLEIFQSGGLHSVSSGINPTYGNGQGVGNCWCVATLTPGTPPTAANPLLGMAIPGVLNATGLAKTGFGDMLVRFKGTVVEKRNVVIALGADLRLPTGDAQNFLGTGAFAGKPFVAMSLYTKPWKNGIVFSPHLNAGWEFAAKSTLGGTVMPTAVPTSSATPPPAISVPLTTVKGYLPDVFSWAAGTEVALGKRNTIVVDVLGNQIGWIHGAPDMGMQTITGLPAPGVTNNSAVLGTASGFVSSGRTSLGQYSGAFGYKARLVGKLVFTFSYLVRFDQNYLTARATPLFGLSYTF
jgi:hypothetical protein